MLHSDSFEALTNNGVHYLFGDNFEGQQFTLQIITYLPSSLDSPFQVFLSDGHAWVKGELVSQAKKQALASTDMKSFTVIRFMSQDIKMNHESFTFKLEKILESRTTIHNIIGEPIPYEDYKKKGFTNALGTNRIENPATVFTLKKIKEMPTGKISGAVVARVVRRPDKVTNFMNIMVEDEEGEQIQCCFFQEVVSKYQALIKVGAWYRFEDPVLQVNNRQNNSLQLKINSHSNIEKVKREGQKEEDQSIGILKPSGFEPKRPELRQFKSKQTGFPEVEFNPQLIENSAQLADSDYWIVARVLRINNIKGDKGRSLQCVEKKGFSVQITLWEEYASQEILVNETYRFARMKARVYKGEVSLHSRKRFTTISVSETKIMKKAELRNQQIAVRGETKASRKQRTLGPNDIIYSLSDMLERASTSKDKACYFLTLTRMIVKLQNKGMESDYLAQLRKKLFYTHCDKCESGDYIRSTRVEPELIDDKLSCSGCKSSNIRVMWNIKANLADNELEISCKINSEIAEKMIRMTPDEGYRELLRNPEQLKRSIVERLNLLRGVFKISAKLNEKRDGERFYNICEYFSDWLRVYLNQTTVALKQAEDTYREYCSDKQKISSHPTPSFLSKGPSQMMQIEDPI